MATTTIRNDYHYKKHFFRKFTVSYTGGGVYKKSKTEINTPTEINFYKDVVRDKREQWKRQSSKKMMV